MIAVVILGIALVPVYGALTQGVLALRRVEDRSVAVLLLQQAAEEARAMEYDNLVVGTQTAVVEQGQRQYTVRRTVSERDDMSGAAGAIVIKQVDLMIEYEGRVLARLALLRYQEGL